MPLSDTDYCIEQITVPPKLPHILKQFCKSAIRTQPYDLLKWSTAYFRALANGELPPVKTKLELEPVATAHGLTFGYVQVLWMQLGPNVNKIVPIECILHHWDFLSLDPSDADLIIKIGKFKSKCEVKKFLAIAVGLLSRNMTETMIKVCELFTFEPEGGSDMIPVCLFMELYGYLAGLKCDGSERDPSNSTISSDDHPHFCVGNNSIDLNSSICTSDVDDNKKRNMTDEQLGSREARRLSADVVVPTATAITNRDRGLGINAAMQGTTAAAGGLGPVSYSSQDTEADMDLDESLTKDDDDDDGGGPPPTLRSFGDSNEESYLHEARASSKSMNRSRASSFDRYEDSDRPYSSEDDRKSMRKSKIDKKDELVDVITDDDVGSAATRDLSKKSSEKSYSGKYSKGSTIDRCYPCVPGIGRRLSAEEVAKVSIWMRDCAGYQSGLVGPRNIRHFSCPPLDGNCSNEESLKDY